MLPCLCISIIPESRVNLRKLWYIKDVFPLSSSFFCSNYFRIFELTSRSKKATVQIGRVHQQSAKKCFSSLLQTICLSTIMLWLSFRYFDQPNHLLRLDTKLIFIKYIDLTRYRGQVSLWDIRQPSCPIPRPKICGRFPNSKSISYV
jgi:hypothetical protein